MADLTFLPMDMVRSLIQNLAILAMVVLFYNFIPDNYISRSKPTYSFCVGVIFALAVAADILISASTTGDSVIGINIVLVPLAGFFGGAVSAVIVGGVLIAGDLSAGGMPFVSPDTITVIGLIFVGTLFHAARDRDYFPRSLNIQLLLLGIGVSLVEFLAFMTMHPVQAPPGGGTVPFAAALPVISITPFFFVSIGALLLLGAIIGFIDRKKQADRDLIRHKEHLEELVKERTQELRRVNSLQNATIESTADGIVVVDLDDRIRAYNRKAAAILNLPPTPSGMPEGGPVFSGCVGELLKEREEFLQLTEKLPETPEQAVMTNAAFRNGRIYEVSVNPEKIDDMIIGRVWSLHDVTAQRQAENAMRAVNSKLILLSSITRHDILNQMTPLLGYLDLAIEEEKNPEIARYLAAMTRNLDTIQLQLEFTRDYGDLGLNSPKWEKVDEVFQEAAQSFRDMGITFTCDCGPVVIYTDPLITRAFYNLIDNSVRHGGNVTQIRLSAERDGPDLVLTYEDNGCGIPPEEKEKIFLKGFGKHTGLGMFLIKEILSITGISIQEDGEPGKGARFRMSVPSGKYLPPEHEAGTP